MDCSLPCSSVHGILQARILGWVAIPFSRGSSRPALQADSLLPEPQGRPIILKLLLWHIGGQGVGTLFWLLMPPLGAAPLPPGSAPFPSTGGFQGSYFPTWLLAQPLDWSTGVPWPSSGQSAAATRMYWTFSIKDQTVGWWSRNSLCLISSILQL